MEPTVRRSLLCCLAALTTWVASSACSSGGGGDAGETPDSGPPDSGQPGAGCSGVDCGVAATSRSIALSADGASLWVVNTDSDSISQIDVATRPLKKEILLAGQRPSVDSTTGRYDPAV